jgi:hypothetical protein
MRTKNPLKRICKCKSGKFNKDHLCKELFTQKEDQNLFLKRWFIINKKCQVWQQLFHKFFMTMEKE